MLLLKLLLFQTVKEQAKVKKSKLLFLRSVSLSIFYQKVHYQDNIPDFKHSSDILKQLSVENFHGINPYLMLI